MTTSPYLRRPLRSYAEAEAERGPRREAVDKPPERRPREPERQAKAAAPAEAGDD